MENTFCVFMIYICHTRRWKVFALAGRLVITFRELWRHLPVTCRVYTKRSLLQTCRASPISRYCDYAYNLLNTFKVTSCYKILGIWAHQSAVKCQGLSSEGSPLLRRGETTQNLTNSDFINMVKQNGFARY